jgi:hypothetical protein
MIGEAVRLSRTPHPARFHDAPVLQDDAERRAIGACRRQPGDRVRVDRLAVDPRERREDVGTEHRGDGRAGDGAHGRSLRASTVRRIDRAACGSSNCRAPRRIAKHGIRVTISSMSAASVRAAVRVQHSFEHRGLRLVRRHAEAARVEPSQPFVRCELFDGEGVRAPAGSKRQRRKRPAGAEGRRAGARAAAAR